MDVCAVLAVTQVVYKDPFRGKVQAGGEEPRKINIAVNVPAIKGSRGKKPKKHFNSGGPLIN
jgi:hypothetical protein